MKITSVLLCLLIFSCAHTRKVAINTSIRSEQDVNLVTTDIDNFWKAYSLCFGKTVSIQEKIFDSIYIKNASICLNEILLKNKLTASGFVKWLNYESDYFSKCALTTNKIKKFEPEIKNYLKKFKTLYPAARYCDIYFMFTQFYTGGQSKNSGIAIGMDYWSLPDSIPVTFTNPLNTELVRKTELMPVTIIHELIHRNQLIKSTGNLLGKCLIEGSADFIAYLVTQKLNNPYMHAFANNHENNLWTQFKNDMATNNTNYWLYNDYDSSRPRDLGYWIGFKICENYYNISPNKSKAIYNIMHITNPDSFLILSKYGLK